MSAIMFYDVETTGFSEKKHALIEVAFIPFINGEKLEPKVFKIKPHEGATIDPGALKINGYTEEEIMTWPEGSVVIKEMIEYLDSFGKKFKQGGHNVPFDSRFLLAFFSRYMCYGDFISIFRSNIRCTQKMAKAQNIPAESFKLKDLCKYFDIPLEDAHKAENDIKATVLLYEKLEAMEPKIKHYRNIEGYRNQRREYLDSRYVIFNPEGDVFIQKEAFQNKEAMRFIISELWDLYCEED